MPSFLKFILLSFQGLIGVLKMILRTKAMKLSDVSYLAPFDFLRLPIISILAFISFGERPDIATIIGACVIFFSSFFISTFANKK